MSMPYLLLLLVLEIEKRLAESIRSIRWPDGLYCPHCHNRNVIKWGKYGFFQRYMCKSCHKSFNDKTKTIFDHSQLPLICWTAIIFFQVIVHISQRQMAGIIMISSKTAFYKSKMLMKQIQSSPSFPQRLEGKVEIDETYLTAGLKGRNNSLRTMQLGRKPRKRGLKRRGSYDVDKPAVIAIILRGKERISMMLKNVQAETLRKVMDKFLIDPFCKLFTDEYPVYEVLSGFLSHMTVSHSIREYAGGEVHINSCEGEFSLLKPFLQVYRRVAKYNLPLYISLYMLHMKVNTMPLIESFRYVLS